MLRVDPPHTGRHRALAVGRDPNCFQSSIGARVKTERALALFFEDEVVIDDPACTPAPFGGLVPFDPRADGVYRGEPLPVLLFDSDQNLPAIWVEPIPGIVHRPGATGGSSGHGGADRRRRGGRSSSGKRNSALGVSPHAGRQISSPWSVSASTKSRMQRPKRRRKRPVDDAQWPTGTAGRSTTAKPGPG